MLSRPNYFHLLRAIAISLPCTAAWGQFAGWAGSHPPDGLYYVPWLILLIVMVAMKFFPLSYRSAVFHALKTAGLIYLAQVFGLFFAAILLSKTLGSNSKTMIFIYLIFLASIAFSGLILLLLFLFTLCIRTLRKK